MDAETYEITKNFVNKYLRQDDIDQIERVKDILASLYCHTGNEKHLEIVSNLRGLTDIYYA